MYATQMIKDLKHYLTKKLPLMEDELNTPKYREQIKLAIQTLRNSPQYYLGNFQDIASVTRKFFPEDKVAPFTGFECKRFKPPYPSFLLCYEENKHKHDNLTNEEASYLERYPYDVFRTGILITQVGTSTFKIEEIAHDVVSGKWRLHPIIKYVTTKDKFTDTSFYEEHGDELEYYDASFATDEGIKAKHLAIDSTVGVSFMKNFIDIDGASLIAIRHTVILHIFLSMIAAPNIVSEVISKRSNSNTKKKKGTLIFKYHVLKFKAKKESKKYIGKSSSRENNGIMPLNWAAGHPKTYTEEAPLFGKHVGTWWWQPHPRGTKKAGFVSKDYCAKESILQV